MKNKAIGLICSILAAVALFAASFTTVYFVKTVDSENTTAEETTVEDIREVEDT